MSLEVEAGERVALQGPSGSGKTLLLRSLALLDPLDQGEVLYEGEPVADDEVPGFRRRVVYLTQAPVLVEGTVADNLALPFRLRRAAPPAAEALGARGRSRVGRVADAMGPYARRADDVDAWSSSRRCNAADGPMPPQPEGRQRFAAPGGVGRRRRWADIDSSSRLAWHHNSLARDPRDFCHGLLGDTPEPLVRALASS